MGLLLENVVNAVFDVVVADVFVVVGAVVAAGVVVIYVVEVADMYLTLY